MSVLSNIQRELQDTEAMIARLDRDLAQNPRLKSILIEQKSLEKRRQYLYEDFLAASNSLGLEVCNYRILAESDLPKVGAIGATLSDYQSLVTILYDAIKHVRQVTKASIDSMRDSAFNFGYAYAGSVGFVFTVPVERLLFDDDPLDQSVKMTFQLAKAAKPEEILKHARQVGPGPIRALYKWASDNAKNGFSISIEWRRGPEIRERAIIQRVEFEQLQAAISMTSDKRDEESTHLGVLTGADAKAKTFRFVSDTSGDIRGQSGSVIDASHTVIIPGRYKVKLRKTSVIKYSTEQETVDWELLVIEPLTA